jgi:hypothetical protein
MKPTNKTPYEIRLELLQLSQTILQNKHLAESGGNRLMSAPTSEEIIAEAEKLNAFVSKANPSH